MIDLPRASDPNKGRMGPSALISWAAGPPERGLTTFRPHQDAFNGRAIYCIEPGVGVNTGDQYTDRGEDFWDNYPST